MIIVQLWNTGKSWTFFLSGYVQIIFVIFGRSYFRKCNSQPIWNIYFQMVALYFYYTIIQGFRLHYICTLVPSVVIYHKGEVDWGTQLLNLPTEFRSATNIAISKIVRKTSLKFKKNHLYNIYPSLPNTHISLEPRPLQKSPIQKITNPLAKRFSSKLLVDLKGVWCIHIIL